jgi:hypothetical protein
MMERLAPNMLGAVLTADFACRGLCFFGFVVMEERWPIV